MGITRPGPPHLRLIKGGDPSRGFTSGVEVLLSEIEHGGSSRAQIRELSESIKAKITFLESKLANDAKDLREDLQSFLVVIASSRQDELRGSGVVFKDPSDPTQFVHLENGETDSPAAQPKIDRIIASCIDVANSDLEFLRTVLTSLKQSKSIPADRFSKLRDILENNSYWRFVEPT